MALFTGQSTEYWHNQGQTDYSNDDWDPPRVSLLGQFDDDFCEDALEAAEAYDDGWEHAKSQDDD